MCSRQVRGFQRFEESGLVHLCKWTQLVNDGWFVVGGIRVNDASGLSRQRGI